MSAGPQPDRGESGQARAWPPRSLCPDCAHVKVVSSEKGSTFFLCLRARTDPRFTKYPPQPVVVCSGFER